MDVIASETARMPIEKCQRALTQMRTLWGSGAPQAGDLCLLEDSSKRRGALSSNIVEAETAKEGQSRNVAGEQVCQRALT